MSDVDLRRFFAPASVAIVGATGDRSRFGGKVMHRVRNFGPAREIFPVNPSAASIDGVPCYGSVRDLPRVPDHVGIVVPVSRIFGVLDECAAIGVPFVTIFSAGFAETGTAEGRARQDRLAHFARETGVRIMGPNCNGLVNFVDGFAMTSSGTVAGVSRPAGTIGLAAQSGGAAQVNVMWRARQIGLDLSYEVSCGNSADLDVLDFVDFMIDDPHTDVIMAIAEVFRSGEKLFAVAARAAARRKPIVVLKLGRSEAGSRAAASHTGALTGSDKVHDAAFGQCGIIRVDDCNELYEVAMLLRTKRLPQGKGLGALSASGGNAAILADLAGRLGIEWPQYSAETQATLGRLLPQHGNAGNPTDVTSAIIGKKDIYRQCVEAIAADPGIDAVVPILTLALQSDVEQVSEAVRTVAKPAAILWTGGCGDNPSLTPETLVAQGIPVYRDASSCLRAMQAAMRYGAFLREREDGTAGPPERPAGLDTARARSLLAGASGSLGERDAKQLLATYGFTVSRETLVTSADEAVLAARAIGGPVALKIASADIPHKTEAGGVRLGLTDEAAIRAAVDGILASARRYAPTASIDGILVQEMAAPGGVEMILGIASDPTFGSAIMVGLGGIHAEILQDLAFRVPPISPDQAMEMLRELRCFPILQGVRGQAPRDVAALCQAIGNLSLLAHDFGAAIHELDINPLTVYEAGQGTCVLDALVTLAPAGDVP